MKVLLVEPGPDFSPADMARGWAKGLRQAGCEVAVFNLADRLAFYAAAHVKRRRRWIKAFDDEGAVRLAVKGVEAACYEFAPDLVLIVSGFFVPPELYTLMRARGHKVILVASEEPYETDRELARAPYVDIMIVNDPTNIDRFRTVNPNSFYIGHAYDPDLHRPGPAAADAASDFAFVGTAFPSRVAFFESVDWTGIDVALAGNWAGLDVDSPLRKFLAHDIDCCCPNEEAVTLYRSTKSSVNLYRRETTDGGTAGGWAMSPREVELAAAGCFYLTEARGENREVLPMVPTFDGPADFEAQLRFYLARPDERDRIANAAREAIAPRAFTSNARQLLQLVGT